MEERIRYIILSKGINFDEIKSKSWFLILRAGFTGWGEMVLIKIG